MPPLAVITETLHPRAAHWLAQHAEVVWCAHDDPDGLRGRLASAQALIVRTYTQVNAALLEQAPTLRVVARAGVGLDNVDVTACRARGVEVVYTPDANTQAVVEYVLGLILDAVRPRVDMPEPVSDAAFHDMRKRHVGRQLDQLTLGIIGFGRIGKRLGRVADALGVRLLVNDLLPEARLRAAAAYPFTFADKPTLLASSDIVSVHVDGRASNRHLINDEALAMLRPRCLFINTSRGMVVDEAALARWARRSADAGGGGGSGGGRAVIDVFDPEPPRPDCPLFGLPNVRLLPHLASRTDEALVNMSWVVRDVVEVLEGRRPRFGAPDAEDSD
jgi:phosphoglycerate dehydrogenase-like enzyme